MYADDIELLKDFSYQAGKMALDMQFAELDVQFKPQEQGPVSLADLKIDAMAKLLLQSARPDYGWLSEETVDTAQQHRLEAKRTIIIDPIDGTNAYIKGRKDFTIATAIIENNTPVVATVYAPAHNKLYWAGAGLGAWCNDTRIRCSGHQSLDNMHILGRKQHVKKLVGPVMESRSITGGFRSSLAYRYCLVAEGLWDAMLSGHKTYEWDAAAGDLILREAGGISKDLCGDDLQFNQQNVQQTPGVLGTSSLRLHHEIMSLSQINNT